MTRTALPMSLTQAAAAEHIEQLHAQAEQHRLSRAARGGKHPFGPTVATLRDALAQAWQIRAGRGGTVACATC